MWHKRVAWCEEARKKAQKKDRAQVVKLRVKRNGIRNGSERFRSIRHTLRGRSVRHGSGA
jgi:hypothetical protein